MGKALSSFGKGNHINIKYSSEQQMQYSTLTYVLLSLSLKKKKKWVDFFPWNYLQRLLCSCISQEKFNVIAWTFLFPHIVHICSIVQQIKRGDWMIRGFFSHFQLAAECFFTVAWFLVSWPTEQWRPLCTAETVLTGG